MRGRSRDMIANQNAANQDEMDFIGTIPLQNFSINHKKAMWNVSWRSLRLEVLRGNGVRTLP